MIRLGIEDVGGLRPDQQEALQQGAFDGEDVWVEFLTVGDNHVRPAHAALHGTVWRCDDPAAPAPPLDYGCFLPGTVVEGFFDGASRAFYSGQAVEIRTKSGVRLRVTPNHPIPTEHGVVPAGSLQPGWKIGRHLRGEVGPGSGESVDEQHQPALVEDVFRTLAEHGGVSSARNSGHEFHGDAKAIDGEIEVVGSYRILHGVWYPKAPQQVAELALTGVHESAAVPCLGLGELGCERGLATGELHASGDMGSVDLALALGSSHSGPLHELRFRLAAELDACGQQALGDSPASDAETLGYRIDGLPLRVRRNEIGRINWRQMQCLRLGEGPHLDACLYKSDADGLSLNPVFLSDLARSHPGSVELDDVVEVVRFDYSGHVYDLRSPCGYVISNGAFASNCRCQLRYVAKPESVAARVFPAADAAPLPRAEVFARYLDARIPEWPQVAAAAAKASPAERLSVAFLTLKKLRPNLGADTRELARMAVEAKPGPMPTALASTAASGSGLAAAAVGVVSGGD